MALGASTGGHDCQSDFAGGGDRCLAHQYCHEKDYVCHFDGDSPCRYRVKGFAYHCHRGDNPCHCHEMDFACCFHGDSPCHCRARGSAYHSLVDSLCCCPAKGFDGDQRHRCVFFQ